MLFCLFNRFVCNVCIYIYIFWFYLFSSILRLCLLLTFCVCICGFAFDFFSLFMLTSCDVLKGLSIGMSTIHAIVLQFTCRLVFNVIKEFARVRFRVSEMLSPLASSIRNSFACLDRLQSLLIPIFSVRRPITSIETALLPGIGRRPP